MKYLLSLLAVAVALVMTISNSSGASLRETPDNTIVLEVAPKGSTPTKNRSDLEDQDKEPFEIIVPVARNFSSLAELFRILREDSMEPQVTSKTPLSYVKGTERNASDFLLFFTDGAGNDST
ncbi:uncharacterized protein LOC128996141 [Macrosteles quadrilineatus]|uniref:uncharacterized protein LOC128996141 n=1 Tax=Macrosteles quadrilineatus TaxID=74068 RepID=UPI0023E0DF5A|nr:uncharacterized protein LOC128996141 [Macrosteles quadrilineatus]